MGIKDEDLEGLSDEEIAALEDDDDESEIIKSIAGDNDEDDEGDEGDEGDDDSGDDDDQSSSDNSGSSEEADAGSAGEQDNGETTSEANEATTDVEPEFQPEFRAVIPEGLAEKLTALDTRTAELMQRFKDGEIELPDFMAQKSDIDNERMQLTLAQQQAEWARSQNEDARAQRWKWEQERFFAQEKAGIYKDPIILAALDASVKQLAADKAHASKPASFFLEEADRQIRKRFNMGGGGTSDSEKNQGANKRSAPDMSKLPKTLSNLPAADLSETGADEFAYLDKLDGIELEQALRKMTPEQEARYLGIAA